MIFNPSALYVGMYPQTGNSYMDELKSMGFDTIGTAFADEAEQIAPNADLVVIVNSLEPGPGWNGPVDDLDVVALELIKRIKRHPRPKVLAVLTTGYEWTSTYTDAGADHAHNQRGYDGPHRARAPVKVNTAYQFQQAVQSTGVSIPHIQG